MIRFARERDKLPIRRMVWEDPGLLRRVVQERFVTSGADVGGLWVFGTGTFLKASGACR